MVVLSMSVFVGIFIGGGIYFLNIVTILKKVFEGSLNLQGIRLISIVIKILNLLLARNV